VHELAWLDGWLLCCSGLVRLLLLLWLLHQLTSWVWLLHTAMQLGKPLSVAARAQC
jgi:hypothetical protein